MDTLRIIVGWAWTYIIVAELVASASGIGYMIISSQAEIPIPLERPRSYEVKATEPFLNLKKQALTLIREEAIKATRVEKIGSSSD